MTMGKSVRTAGRQSMGADALTVRKINIPPGAMATNVGGAEVMAQELSIVIAQQGFMRNSLFPMIL